MKRTLLAAAVLGLAATGANAQVVNVWQGNLFVESITEVAPGNCSFSGGSTLVGDNYRIQYKPSGMPGNLTGDVMTFTSSRAAFAIRTATGRILGSGSSFQTGISGGSVNVFGFGGNISPPNTPNSSYSSIAFVPAGFTEATQYLSMTGVIDNWTGLTGCSATVRAVMVKRVTPPPS